MRTDSVNLLFEGGWGTPTIPAALAAVLLVTAAWRLLRGRRRDGLFALAAAGGPVCLLAALATFRRLAWPALTGLAVLIAGGVAACVLAPQPRTATAVATAWWVAVATGVFYAAALEHLTGRQFAALLTLRLGAIAVLLGLLLKPTLSFAPVGEESRPPVVVLVDRSASMATVDHDDTPDRYGQAIGALRGLSGRISRQFDLRWSYFARQAHLADDLDALATQQPSGPDADATHLAAAIDWAARPIEGPRPAAVLVLSDGIQTGAGDPRRSAADAGVPIYSVVLGSQQKRRRNLRVARLQAPLEVIENNRFTVTVETEATGVADQVVEVELVQEGRPLAAQSQIPSAGGTDSIGLTFIPSSDNAPSAGGGSLRRLTVRAAPVAGEVTGDDNDAEIHVWVADSRIRVLYVESIRPEFKFLSGRLRRDPSVTLVTMVHLSADKFVVGGSIDGREPTGLPVTDAQWDLYNVVIVGDVEARVWQTGQLRNLDRFVRRGGGLVMLGGARSFGPGGYGDTPLAATLPLHCGSAADATDSAPFVPRLTADGAANPITSFLIEFLPSPSSPAPATPLPSLAGLVRTDGLKGGAVALASHPASNQVVLAVGRVGEGRSMAFTPFAAWRWHLQLAGRGRDSPYGRFWRQAIRYLAAADTDVGDLAPQVLGRLGRPHADVGESVALTAHTRRFEPAAVAVEAVLASAPDTAVVTTPLAAAPDAGRFTGAVALAASGRYVLRFVASDGDGNPVATDELPLVVLARGDERDRIARNDSMLADVARRSGGRSCDLTGLTELIDQMIATVRPHEGPHAATLVRLHNLPMGLLAMVVLLTVEWTLRRRWQLR